MGLFAVLATIGMVNLGFYYWQINCMDEVQDSPVQADDMTVRTSTNIQQASAEEDIRDAPLIELDYELPTINGRITRLNIGISLSRERLSTLLTVRDRPDLVIKYQCNCDDLDERMHPLAREFWALDTLRTTELVPRTYFLSAESGLGPTLFKKTNFRMSAAERTKCAINGGTVRYMVIERLEIDSYRLVKEHPLSVIDALRVLRSMIVGIGTMHSRGIIHADIHPGNIMFTNKDDLKSLRFIDFGTSIRAEELKTMPERVRPPLSYIHCYLSHWNLNGYRFSYRDDIFKAIFVAAFLMHGPRYIEHCTSLESNGRALLRRKQEGFIFDYPGSRISNINSPLRRRLEKLLHIVRSMNEIDAIPPYGKLISQIDRAIDAAMKPEP